MTKSEERSKTYFSPPIVSLFGAKIFAFNKWKGDEQGETSRSFCFVSFVKAEVVDAVEASFALKLVFSGKLTSLIEKPSKKFY